MKILTTAILSAAVAGIAAAQGTLLYVPVKLIADQGITVKGWGSGTISETDETSFEGVRSIRISSRNFFQGGILNFEKPVDLSGDFNNKANLLRIAFKAPSTAVVSSGGASGGPSAGGSGGGGAVAGGDLGGNRGGGGGSRQGAGGGRPGAPGAGGAGNQGATQTQLNELRLIITTTDGKKSEAYVPVKGGDGTNWVMAAVPIQAIRGFDRTNKMVKSIAIAPDTTSTFYVGDLRVIEDTTPISGEITTSALNLGANQEVQLSSYGVGGASLLKYSWDFDESDGIQEDATGQVVKRRFRKPGTYTITLTISDYFGLKEPFRTTVKAVVNG